MWSKVVVNLDNGIVPETYVSTIRKCGQIWVLWSLKIVLFTKYNCLEMSVIALIEGC
jgi:hypothetical protein